MSRGPGAIEARIADLLAETRDRALSIDDIADHAFALACASPSGLPGNRPARFLPSRKGVIVGNRRTLVEWSANCH
jgi:hypothetical protein